MHPNADELTRLLRCWADGEAQVEERLAEMIYPLLRRLAARQLRGEQTGRTLATTDLVHEAYLDIFRGAPVDWRDRRHFIALAAQVVRRLVVDAARRRQSQKRGGDGVRLSLDGLEVAEPQRGEQLLALDEALGALAEVDADAARITELRFFSGMSAQEIAEVCDVSTATVTRRWRFARAFLRQRVHGLSMSPAP